MNPSPFVVLLVSIGLAVLAVAGYVCLLWNARRIINEDEKRHIKWIEESSKKRVQEVLSDPLLQHLPFEFKVVDSEKRLKLLCDSARSASEVCVYASGEFDLEPILRDCLIRCVREKSRPVEILSGPIAIVPGDDQRREILFLRELRKNPSQHITIRLAKRRMMTHFAVCDGFLFIEVHVTPNAFRRPSLIFESTTVRDPQELSKHDLAKHTVLKLWKRAKDDPGQFHAFINELPQDRHLLRLTRLERDLLEEELLRRELLISDLSATEILHAAETFENVHLREVLFQQRDDFQSVFEA